MRRRLQGADIWLFSSLFVLVFLAALTVNFLANKLIARAEQELLSTLGSEYNLSLEYKSIYFDSFSSITVEGVSIYNKPESASGTNTNRESRTAASPVLSSDQGPGEALQRRGLLGRIGKVVISVNIADLLFSDSSVLQALETVEVERPRLYFYGDRSLFSEANLSGSDSASEQETTELPQADFIIRQGEFKLLPAGDFGKENVSKARAGFTLDSLKIRPDTAKSNQFRIFLDGRLYLLPESSAFSAVLRSRGQVDVNGGEGLNGEIHVALVNLNAAGAHLPDLRFAVRMQEGRLSINSTVFNQAVYISGRRNEQGQGSVRMTINENADFFRKFIDRNFREDMEGVFFVPGEQYQPSGYVEYVFGELARFQADLKIRDKNQKEVFRFLCYGNERMLNIEKFFLIRDKRRFNVQGQWDFDNPLPSLEGSLQAVRFGDYEVGGSFNLRSRKERSYTLALRQLSVNNQDLGMLEGTLDFPRDSGIDFRFVKGSGELLASGRWNGDAVLAAEFEMTRLPLDSLQMLTGELPFAETMRISGKLDLAIDGEDLESGGQLTLVDGPDTENFLVLDFLYATNTLLVNKAEFPGYAIRLEGEGRLHRETVELNMDMEYAGRPWPLHFVYYNRPGRHSFEATVGKSLLVTGDLQGAESRLFLRLSELPLSPFGVNGTLRGTASWLIGEEGQSGNGRLHYGALASDDALLRGISLEFSLSNQVFNIKRLALENKQGTFEGAGQAAWGDEDLRVQARLGEGFRLLFQKDGEKLDGRLRFNNFRLPAFLSSRIQGVLDGKVNIGGQYSRPEIGADLRFRDGRLEDTPFSFDLRLASRQGQIEVERGQFRYGNMKADISAGFLRQSSAGGYSLLLNNYLSIDGDLLSVSGNHSVRGRISPSATDVRVHFPEVDINKRRMRDVAFRLQYRNGMFQFLRRGPTGVTGFYNARKDVFSMRLYTDNISVIEVSGELSGPYPRFYLLSEDLQLSAINFFPAIIENASGTGRLELDVKMTDTGPVLNGIMEVDRGSLDLSFMQKPIEPFSMKLRFRNDRIELLDFGGPVGRGALSISGNVFLRNGRLEDLELRLKTDMEKGVPLDLYSEDLRSKGYVRGDVFIEGDLDSPHVRGRLSLYDNNFYYMEDLNSSGGPETFLDRIRWNLEVTALERVYYSSSLLNAQVKAQSRLMLRNRIKDSDFLMQGKLEVQRGTIDYLNQEYRIQTPTYLEFRPQGRGYDVWVQFRGSMRTRDADNEEVTIYLSYAGLIENLQPRYSSDPPLPEDELMALIGLGNKDEEKSLDKRQEQGIVGRSTELFTLLGIRYLTSDVRRTLGLDLLSLRTPVFRYLYERGSMDTLDPDRRLSIWRDTELSLGKYLTDFMFLEYTLRIKEDETVEKMGEITLANQIGLEFSFDLLNLGYVFRPLDRKRANDEKYEHSLEFRFRQRF